jgi:two-component system chemotaxis response regulator CheY
MARALIVDDSKFMRRIIRETIEGGGHTVLAEAENGYEALDAYKAERPDFVTMDITMMGKDGLKTVDELIAFDNDARIIVISAMNENVLKNARGVNIPVRAFLQKPFEKETLLDTIKKVL